MSSLLKRRQVLFSIASGISFLKFNVGLVYASSNLFIPGFLINIFLEKKFPIHKDLLFFQIDFSNPELGFLESEQRLSLKNNLVFSLGNHQNIAGQTHCSSAFTYNPKKRALELKSPSIDQINFSKFGAKEQILIQQAYEFLASALEGLTIYEFKDNDFMGIKPPQKILIERDGIRLYFE